MFADDMGKIIMKRRRTDFHADQMTHPGYTRPGENQVWNMSMPAPGIDDV
jgi:hypothetical protein